MKLSHLLNSLKGLSIKAIKAKGLHANSIEASWAGDISMTSHYIDHGANLDLAERGWTALAHAVSRSDLRMARLLLRKGANPNLRVWAAHNGGVINLAAQHPECTMVDLLLKRGADVNLTDDDGYHALIIAVLQSGKSWELAKLLLEGGASVNLPDKRGFTALSYAADYDDFSTMVQLLQHRASTDIRVSNRSVKEKLNTFWAEFQRIQMDQRIRMDSLTKASWPLLPSAI